MRFRIEEAALAGEAKPCFFPVSAVSLHPRGKIHFCLTSKLTASASLEELDRARHEVDSSLRRGDFPASCSGCQNIEEKGLVSRRLRTIERKKQTYGEEKLAELLAGGCSQPLRHFEISFSQACNLRCAMCSSDYSTGWNALDQEAAARGLSFRERYLGSLGLENGNPGREALLERLFTQLPGVDLILIKGGEPTLDPDFRSFLRKLNELWTPTQKTFVSVTTNGTVPPEKWIPENLSYSLEIGVSLDGWGATHEWMRDSSFERTLANLRKLDERPEVAKLDIYFTLTCFNAYHLPEFLRNVVALRRELKKFRSCTLGQWAKEPWVTAAHLPLEDRKKIGLEVKEIFRCHESLFLDTENLLRVLELPRPGEAHRKLALDWFHFLREKRGALPDEPKILRALAPDRFGEEAIRG